MICYKENGRELKSFEIFDSILPQGVYKRKVSSEKDHEYSMLRELKLKSLMSDYLLMIFFLEQILLLGIDLTSFFHSE